MSNGRMRGFVLKSAFGLVQRLPPDRSASVRAHLPADLPERIERAGGLGWMTMDDFCALAIASRAGLSPAEFDAMWAETGKLATEHPLIGSVVRFAVKATGAKPDVLLRAIDVIFGLVTEGSGALSTRSADTKTGGELVWADPPRNEDAFFDACARGIIGVITLSKVETKHQLRREGSQAVIAFSWS